MVSCSEIVVFSAEPAEEARAGMQAGIIATAHESQIEYRGWVGEGYIIIDPATGSGAYKIADGDDGGLLVAFDILVGVLNFLYGLLNAIAVKFGSRLLISDKIDEYLTIAGFVLKALNVGLGCGGWVKTSIFFATLSGLVVLMITDLVTTFYNPLASFVVGGVLDYGLSFLGSQIQECS